MLKVSKWLYQCIKVPNMIGSLVSGATASPVAKKGTKKNIPLLWMKSSKKPQVKKFHETDPPKSENFDSKYDLEIFECIEKNF